MCSGHMTIVERGSPKRRDGDLRQRCLTLAPRHTTTEARLLELVMMREDFRYVTTMQVC